MKRLLFLVLLSLPLASWGQNFNYTVPSGQEVKFHVVSTTAHTVDVSYASSSIAGDLVIPSTVPYNGVNYTVVEVRSYGFYNCTGLTSVVLPATVTKIDYNGFEGCSGLISVDLGGATEIGNYAFKDCTNLSSVNPGSVTKIGSSAFDNCGSLSSVDMSSTTEIGAYAFRNCSSLTSASLPNITSLGNRVFYQCTSLAEVDIPSCTTLGDFVFYTCSTLTSIELPNCTSIGEGAFSGCSSLATVDLSNCTSIGESAFSHCSNLGSVDLSSATEIGDMAFLYCTSLTTVSLPNCTSIGISAFSSCSSLTSASLPSITTLGNNIFYECSSLASVDLASCTTLGEYVFSNCTTLTQIELPNCTTIGERAFNYCTNLSSVSIHNCTTIANKAFYYCSSLASIDLPSCTTIGENAFYYCSSLTAANLSNCTTIGAYAFYRCNLSSLTLSDACTSIGNSAFYGNKLTTFTLPDGVSTIGSNAFSGTTMLFYNGSATGSPWGAKYHNGVIGTGLSFSVNDDGTWTLHVGSGVTSFPDFTSGVKVTEVEWLSRIEVDAANSTYSSVDGVLYNKSKEQLMRVPAAYSGNLTIGVNVTSIAQKAFYGCGQIDTLFFNASACVPAGTTPTFSMASRNTGTYENPIYIKVPNYYSGIFDTLTNINVLEVGEDVDTLYYAISSLPGVKHINVSEDNWNYFSTDGLLVNESGNTVLRCPTGREGAFTFPSGLTRVSIKAFTFCQHITSLDLSPLSYIEATNVYDKEEGAFAYCIGLRTLTIPATLDTLGHYAFYGNHLDTLYYNSPNAISVADATRAAMYGVSSGGSVFASDSLRVVIVGNGVTRLADDMFNGCKALNSVQLPEGLEVIDDCTFGDCSSLAEIVLPSTLRVIDTCAFEGCTALENIQLPDSLKIIGNCAFAKCTSLEEISIPPAVNTIGESALYKCTSLKRIYYNAIACTLDTFNSSTGMSWPTLHGSYEIFKKKHGDNNSTPNSAVEHMIVGEGVKLMPPYWMTNVDTLTLPTTLEAVIMPYRRFSNHYPSTNSSLRQVYFNCHDLRVLYGYSTNDSVNTTPLFGFTTALKHVAFGDSVRTIPTYCFRNCDQVREFINLELPATLTALGSGAFENCTQIKSAVIPERLTEVGASPFLGCKKLKKITYSATESTYYGDLTLPNLDRSYTPNSALTYNNVAHWSPRRSKVALADMLPPVDTITISQGVRNIAPCFFGFPWNQLLDTAGFDRTVYIDNQSTSLRTIGNGAFANMVLENAQSLFTDSLQYIDQAAFMNASGLHSVNIPEGCWYVGAGAFRNCKDLDSLWLPSSLQWVGTDAFLLDSNLRYLYYDCDSLGIDHVEPVSCTPFGNTVSLHSIDFGPHVRYLTEGLFRNAEGLERLVLPEGLLQVGNKCFSMKVNNNHPAPTATPTGGSPMPVMVVIIQSGYISGKVDTVSLHYVSLPSTLTKIGSDAFRLETPVNPVTYIDTVVCRGAVPPAFDGYPTKFTYAVSTGSYPPDLEDIWYSRLEPVFNDTVLANGTLIVPCGARSAYENSYGLEPVGDVSAGSWAGYCYGYTWEPVTHPSWAEFQNIEETMVYGLQLTVNEDTMGTATWACADGGVELAATANPNHRFLHWSDGVEDNPRIVALTQDTALQAVFAWGELYDVQVYSTNNSRGTVSGSGTYVQASIDTLVATPAYGYHFSQWSDGDTTNPRFLTVLSNTTLSASFEPNQYQLTVVCNDSQGTTDGSGSYDYNTTHSISATAAVGYHFTGWSDGATANPRTVTVLGDTTFTALFAINVYTVGVGAADEHGSVSGNGEYEHGALATLTATADAHYHFSQWSDGDTTNPRTLTVVSDTVLSAQFAINQYALELTVDDATHGTTTGGGSYDYLTQCTITAIPAAGYHFVQWSDGNTDNPRTIALTQDTAFSATFSLTPYTIATAASDPTLGYTQGGGTYYYGDTLHISAFCTADHHHFVQWSDGNQQAERTITVYGDSLLTALFAIDTHNVALTANDEAMGHAAGPLSAPYGATITITATATGGHHFGMWDNGTTETPYTLTITSDTAITALFTPDLYPQLCLVSVEGEHNRIVWQPLEEACTAYRLYRESSTAGQYEFLAEVPYGSVNVYVDSTSHPIAHSYRYRISAIDPYGLEGEQSAEHKTMHLTINKGTGNTWNLVWTEYEGAPYLTYIIYRGTSNQDMQQIDEIPSGGNTTYTDAQAPQGDAYYQVGVVMTNPCDVAPAAKSSSISRSNIANTSGVGIDAVDDNGIRLAVTGGRIVAYGYEGDLKVYDAVGRRIENRDLPTGVYMVRLGNATRRVVVL